MICPKCGSEDLLGAERSWWMYIIPGFASYRCDDCDHRIVTRGRLPQRQTEEDDWDDEEDVEIDIEQDKPIETAQDEPSEETVQDEPIESEEELTEPVAVAEPEPAPESKVVTEEDKTTENIALLYDERIREAENMVKKMKKSQPISGREAQDV